MFYSRLRWKIHDLEQENKTLIDRNDSLSGQCKKFADDAYYAKEKARFLEDENEVLKHDLAIVEEQLTVANDEIRRLQKESDHLWKRLKKKGCCPCDQRRKH